MTKDTTKKSDDAGEDVTVTKAAGTGQPSAGDGDEVLDQPVGSERFANAGTGEDVTRVNVLKDGDVSGAYKAYEGGEELVEVTQDVVETFYFPDTKRPATRLRFTKGQIVRKSEIDALAQAAPAQS